MSELADIKKNPAKTLAAELLALNPHLTIEKVAAKVGVKPKLFICGNKIQILLRRYMIGIC